MMAGTRPVGQTERPRQNNPRTTPGDLGQVGYLLYETRGTVTVIGADREPGPLGASELGSLAHGNLAGPA
jgi:hypothetical protein